MTERNPASAPQSVPPTADFRAREQEMLQLAHATPLPRLQEKYVAAAARYAELAEARERMANGSLHLPSSAENEA